MRNVLNTSLPLCSKVFDQNWFIASQDKISPFQVITGIFGLLGNSISIIVLTRPAMRNSFNLLLVVLICFDNTFILFAVLDYACVRGKEQLKHCMNKLADDAETWDGVLSLWIIPYKVTFFQFLCHFKFMLFFLGTVNLCQRMPDMMLKDGKGRP